MKRLWDNPRFYSVARWEGNERILHCGECRAEILGIELWTQHWGEVHGTIQEARAHLARRARRSARTQELAKSNREHRKIVDRKKMSALPGARVARALAQWWRQNWPHCARCRSPIELRLVAGSSVSFCPTHGAAWEWNEEELFWTAAPPSARTWERRRLNGNVTSSQLQAWATRRARGHVAQDSRRAWATRIARYGPRGMSVASLESIAARNRVSMAHNWKDPAYRARQVRAISLGWRRRLGRPAEGDA